MAGLTETTLFRCPN